MLGSLQGLQPNAQQQQIQSQQQNQPLQPGQQAPIPPPPPQNGQDFTLSSVLHYLQTEWRRYERDRNEWEIERAEMRVRFSPPLSSHPDTSFSVPGTYRPSRGRTQVFRECEARPYEANKDAGVCSPYGKVHQTRSSPAAPDVTNHPTGLNNSPNRPLIPPHPPNSLPSKQTLLYLLKRTIPIAKKKRVAAARPGVKVSPPCLPFHSFMTPCHSSQILLCLIADFLMVVQVMVLRAGQTHGVPPIGSMLLPVEQLPDLVNHP